MAAPNSSNRLHKLEPNSSKNHPHKRTAPNVLITPASSPPTSTPRKRHHHNLHVRIGPIVYCLSPQFGLPRTKNPHGDSRKSVADVGRAVRACRVRIRRRIGQALANRGRKSRGIFRGRELDGHVPQLILFSPIGAKTPCVKNFDA